MSGTNLGLRKPYQKGGRTLEPQEALRQAIYTWAISQEDFRRKVELRGALSLFAERVGVSREYLDGILSGKISPTKHPQSLKTAEKIAKEIGKTAVTLWPHLA